MLVTAAGVRTNLVLFVGSASALFVLLFMILLLRSVVELSLHRDIITDMHSHQSSTDSALTIRVNTFRRLDLLETFLDHYDRCRVVRQIQVVWSDPETPAPTEWSKRYADGNVVFEVHDTNSLNHRFHRLVPVPTEVRWYFIFLKRIPHSRPYHMCVQAVLSIDDDLVIPCDVIERTLRTWWSSKR